MCMSKIFGHRKCKSEVEVMPKKIDGVHQPMLLVTDKNGNIVAATKLAADITINGTLTADKVIGAVYM